RTTKKNNPFSSKLRKNAFLFVSTKPSRYYSSGDTNNNCSYELNNDPDLQRSISVTDLSVRGETLPKPLSTLFEAFLVTELRLPAIGLYQCLYHRGREFVSPRVINSVEHGRET
ncbi:hypothetical protein K0M31_001024, partial [Melipona bicolor]